MDKRTAQNKIEANRSNAQRSTGPKTPKGKEIVAGNALKHGLMARQTVIAGESQAEYNAFRAATFDDRAPVGIFEHQLTDIIADAFWRLRRVTRIETELMDSFTDTPRSQGKKEELPFTVIIRKTYTGLPPEENAQLPTIEEPLTTVSGQPPTANGQELLSADEPPEAVSGQSPTANGQQLSATPPISLGKAFITDIAAGNALTRLQRYEAHLNRVLYKAIAELRNHQRERRSRIDIDNIIDGR